MDHTADIGVSAHGETLEEALRWLAAGTFSLIVDPGCVASNVSRVVFVTARDQESLAVDWLNELLYQYEAMGFLLKECRISLEGTSEESSAEGGELTLQAHCRGDNLNPARHHILTVGKAATYHGLSVAPGSLSKNWEWQISVILDV